MTIFLLERNGDITVHESVGAATSSMESPYIESGEWVRAFDEKGNIYSITTLGTIWTGTRSFIPRPGILTPTEEKAPAELYEALRQRFAKGTVVAPPSLEELVSLAIKVSTTENEERRKKTARIFYVLGAVFLLALYIFNRY